MFVKSTNILESNQPKGSVGYKEPILICNFCGNEDGVNYNMNSIINISNISGYNINRAYKSKEDSLKPDDKIKIYSIHIFIDGHSLPPPNHLLIFNDINALNKTANKLQTFILKKSGYNLEDIDELKTIPGLLSHPSSQIKNTTMPKPPPKKMKYKIKNKKKTTVKTPSIMESGNTALSTVLPDLEPPISISIVETPKVKMSSYDSNKYPKDTAKIITFG